MTHPLPYRTAVAFATLDFLVRLGCWTLFVTHYPILAQLQVSWTLELFPATRAANDAIPRKFTRGESAPSTCPLRKTRTKPVMLPP
jgi:hypothetical protein